ncbi:hypothetical protein ACLOJK_023367 [Asimina triloba]
MFPSDPDGAFMSTCLYHHSALQTNTAKPHLFKAKSPHFHFLFSLAGSLISHISLINLMGEKLKLVEVSEQEVCIDFKLGCKCRANINLKSIHPTKSVAFKIQTSSPHSFLVNPPNGLIRPLQSTSFQVILKPQNHPPSSFPRSPSDRFLIKTALAHDDDPASDDDDHHHGKSPIDACFSSANATHEVKLKVVYVGLFLLRRAVAAGDVDAVKHMIKRRRPSVPQLPPQDAMSVLQAASTSGNVGVLNLLLQAGLHVGGNNDQDEEQHVQTEMPNIGNAEMELESKGWTAIHAASAADRYEVLVALVQEAVREGWLDGRDRKGRTALHLAASKGHARCLSLLMEAGCEKNARSNDGRTALFRAAAKGDVELVALLVEAGADPSIGTSLHGHGPIDVARDKGHMHLRG